MNAAYLKNKSAFDVAFILRTPDGSNGIVGIETKYHEHAAAESTPHGDKLLRYAQVTEDSGTFERDWPKRLLGTELQQIWLDHLLVLSMLQNRQENWTWGRLLLVYPEKNISFVSAAARYREVLKDGSTFDTRTVEQLIDAHVLPSELEKSFRQRYFW